MASFKKDLIKFLPRKEQTNALNYIKNVISKKPDTKYFMLQLPTGTGKSALAMMIADFYTTEIDKSSKVDIITATKILQDQYSDTFESVSNLKGKENYECAQWACSCAQGEEFNKLNKTKCEGCDYSNARQSYLLGDMSLTNFYLYILYSIYKPDMVKSRNARLLIVDECHELDEVICNFISIKITENLITKLKLVNEYEIIKKLKDIKKLGDDDSIKEEYVGFLRNFKTSVSDTLSGMQNAMDSGIRNANSDKRDLRIDKLMGDKNGEVKMMQTIIELENYKTKIEVFLKDYKTHEDNWVVETVYNEKTKEKELSLEPIWANEYLERYVWSRYDMVILMSGTILNKDMFSKLNGIDSSKSVYYSINSPFLAKNRKVYYMPVARMTYKNKIEAFKEYVPVINKILNKYSDSKGIIHSNSFELANWIKDGVDNKRLLFHTSENKDVILKTHLGLKEPSVLVSPSMATGVSFDNDHSRFQIIAKIPYPSLGSMKNKTRLKQMPEYYPYKTICALMQMCGRSIRSRDDYADTVIIDQCFSDLLKHNSHYFPKWFSEHIKTIEVKK